MYFALYPGQVVIIVFLALSRKTLMCKRFFVALFLLVATTAQAADGHVLQRWANSDGPLDSRIILVFSSLPPYKVRVTGSRVDVLLAKTRRSPHLASLPKNRSVAEVFSGRQGGDLLLSFLLKRAPQHVNTAAAANPASLVLILHWGNNSPPIVPRLLGQPTLQRGAGTTKMVVASPYAGHWKSFYRNYRVPIRIAPPLHYLLPPFPWRGLGALPEPVLSAARSGHWAKAASLLDQTARRPGKHRTVLFLAEAAARLAAGDAKGGARALAEMGKLSPASPLASFAAYLSAYSSALSGDPYGAAYALSFMPAREKNRGVLAPYFKILTAELAIATGSFTEGNKALAAGRHPFPRHLELLRRLRRADLQYAAGAKERAYILYSRLGNSPLFRTHPWSLAAYAHTLLTHDQFRRAAARYEELAHLLQGRPGEGLALYAAAWSQLAVGAKGEGMLKLRGITQSCPGSDGAFRARLKTNDLLVLGSKDYGGVDALQVYKNIALHASSLGVREAASFKEALTASLQGQRVQAIAQLEVFLRDFAGRSLCREARARLLELLPPVVDGLLRQHRDIEGLALVEQNRDLLLADRSDRTFLLKVGEAFGRLGLWGRSVKVFQSLYRRAKTPGQEESSYLPLIKALFHQQEFKRLLRYAAAYQKLYPHGKDGARIFQYRIKTLLASKRSDAALKLLQEKRRPDDLGVELLAGRIFFHEKKFAAAAHVLSVAMERDLQKVPSESRWQLAEALYADGRPRRALPLYQRLQSVAAFSDQAAYRCAQITIQMGNHAKGLKLLRRLAEKGKSRRWREMARQTLNFETL